MPSKPQAKVCDKDIKVTISRREQWINFWLRWTLIWTVAFGAYVGTIAFIVSYVGMDHTTQTADNVLSNAAMSSGLDLSCPDPVPDPPGIYENCVITNKEASIPIVFYTAGPPLPPPALPPSPPLL